MCMWDLVVLSRIVLMVEAESMPTMHNRSKPESDKTPVASKMMISGPVSCQ